jgi:hypothetical protein
MNPVGPEEASTYWRRRAVFGVAGLVVLWVLWLILNAALNLGSGDPKATPSLDPSASATPAPDPSASAPPSSSASPESSPSGSPSSTVTSVAGPACAQSDLEVAVMTASGSAPVGAGMGLTISITNKGATACSRDVGPAANELRVTSGAVLVWSSDHCNPSSKSDVKLLPPGEPWTASLAWAGTVVSATCPKNPPTAQPGTYRAIARNGDLESKPATFLVK